MGKKSTARAAAVAQYLAGAADLAAYVIAAPGDAPSLEFNQERLWTRESNWVHLRGAPAEEKVSFKVVVPVGDTEAERVYEVTVREVKS